MSLYYARTESLGPPRGSALSVKSYGFSKKGSLHFLQCGLKVPSFGFLKRFVALFKVWIEVSEF